MIKIREKLNKSPINYFSDLFIGAMVIAWIVAGAIMTIMAIYATVFIQDTSIWSEVGTLVAVPLTAGGAIWMVKNSVQHAIAYNRGERAFFDFPATRADGEEDGLEEEYPIEKEEEYDAEINK